MRVSRHIELLNAVEEAIAMGRPKNAYAKPKLVKDAKFGVWFITWTDVNKGYTRKRSTGTTDRAEAQKVLHAKAGAIVAPGPRDGDNYTVGELLHAYEAAKEGDVANAELYALVRLHEYFDKFAPAQLNDGVWKKYRGWRTGHDHENAAAQYQKTKKKVSDATACRELNVMRAALAWARRDVRWRGLSHVRVILPDAGQQPREDFLTKEQVNALLAACETDHTRLFVMLAITTGARHRAILSLKWSDITWPSGAKAPNVKADIDLQAVVKVVPHGKELSDENALGEGEEGFPGFSSGTRFVTWSSNPQMTKGLQINLGAGQGNKRRPLGVVAKSNTPLYRALYAAYQRRTCDYVIEWRGGPIKRVDLADAYRRAGIPKPRAPQHVLKHSMISWLLQSGAEIAKVAKLTRTSIQTIERTYGHLQQEHVEAIADVLTVG